MRILVTADWHFHPFRAFSRIGEDGVNSRLADIARAWRWCLEQAKKEGCEVMCVAGDLFHVRGQLKPSVVNVVLWCISDAVDRYGMRLVMIPGNHDMEDFRGGPTAVDLFGGMMGVHVLHDRVVEINGVKFMGIPYRHDVEEFLRVARELREAHDLQPGRAVVLCHQGVDSCWSDPRMPETGLTASALREVFGEDVSVLLGHYHQGWRTGDVVQVGAPIQHDFNSEGRDSGCWIYDTKDCSYHRVENDFSPRFVTIYSERDSWDEGDFLRVVNSDLKEAERIAEESLKRGAGGVITQIVRDAVEYRAAEEAVGMEPCSVRSMVERYVSGQPDMEPYAARILALYDEVCA